MSRAFSVASFLQKFSLCLSAVMLLCLLPGALSRAQTPPVSEEHKLAAELLAADNDEERRKLLDAKPQLVTEALLKALISKLNEFIAGGRLKQVESGGRFTAELAERLESKRAAALAWEKTSWALIVGGEPAKSLECSRRGLAFAEATQDQPLILLLLNSLGRSQDRLGQVDSATETYEKTLRLAREWNIRHSLAATLTNYAAVQQGKSDYTSMLEMAREALVIFQDLNDKRGISVALSQIAGAREYLGDLRGSLETYQQSLNLARESNDKRRVGLILGNMGVIYATMGLYQETLDAYQQALKLREEVGDKELIATTLNNLGRLYARQGDYAKHDEYVLKALRLSEQYNLPQRSVAVLNNMGLACLEQRRYDCAADYLRQGLESALKIKMMKQAIDAQRLLGKVHLAQNRFEQAIECFQQSLQWAEETKSKLAIAAATLHLSEAWTARKDFAQALVPAEKALALIDLRERPGWYAWAMELRGRALAGLEQPEAARQSFLSAIQAVEKERAQSLNAEEMRQSFLGGRLMPYHALIQLLVDLRTPAATAEALEIAQRLNGRVLLDKLTGAAANPPLPAAVSLSPSEISGLIDDQTAVLNFAVTSKSTYLFTVTKDATGTPSLSVQTIAVTQTELAEKVNRVRQRLANLDAGFRAPAAEMFQLLVAPAAAQLSARKKLILIPDGPLWELPFQALIAADGRYLIQQHAVSYAPSLPALRELTKSGNSPSLKTAARLLLAFGNGETGQPGRTDTKTNAGSSSGLMSQGALPEAERQAKTLGQLYGPTRSKIYTGNDASEDRFLAEAGQYHILHLASHGLLNNSNPLYSGLKLTPGGDKSDGLLEAHELMKLKLNAELVVLSACETARGRISNGEGMIGLSWAMMLAGSRATVVSQWKVEAAGTEELMLEFHRRMKINLDRSGQLHSAESLRQAMLKLMNRPQFRHPAYWAGFILLGRPD